MQIRLIRTLADSFAQCGFTKVCINVNVSSWNVNAEIMNTLNTMKTRITLKTITILTPT